MLPSSLTAGRRNFSFIGVIVLIIAACLMLPDLYISPYARDEERCVGTVLAVDDGQIQRYGIVKAGSQKLTVRLDDGAYKGREVMAGNDLIGKMESDKMFAVGDRVLVVVTTIDEEIVNATAYDHYRLPTQLILVAIFAMLLVAFTGFGGARAFLSFVFAIVVMWKVLLPSILRGGDPILVALGLAIVIAGVTLHLVAGVGRTAMAAWLGAILGIVLTAGLAWLFFPLFRLHGAVQPFSETLLYSGFEHLDLGRLFVAAVFLGASGAVIDVAIDVAAAMEEVARKRPDLTGGELLLSGLRVGRAMVSTMITTLLMAYMSGSISLLMVLLSKGIPPVQILNLNFIAAEILKTVVGSFGLVAVAPFTALCGALLFAKSWSLAETMQLANQRLRELRW
jgi:uncharacterized membrane protein